MNPFSAPFISLFLLIGSSFIWTGESFAREPSEGCADLLEEAKTLAFGSSSAPSAYYARRFRRIIQFAQYGREANAFRQILERTTAYHRTVSEDEKELLAVLEEIQASSLDLVIEYLVNSQRTQTTLGDVLEYVQAIRNDAARKLAYFIDPEKGFDPKTLRRLQRTVESLRISAPESGKYEGRPFGARLNRLGLTEEDRFDYNDDSQIHLVASLARLINGEISEHLLAIRFRTIAQGLDVKNLIRRTKMSVEEITVQMFKTGILSYESRSILYHVLNRKRFTSHLIDIAGLDAPTARSVLETANDLDQIDGTLKGLGLSKEVINQVLRENIDLLDVAKEMQERGHSEESALALLRRELDKGRMAEAADAFGLSKGQVHSIQSKEFDLVFVEPRTERVIFAEVKSLIGVIDEKDLVESGILSQAGKAILARQAILDSSEMSQIDLHYYFLSGITPAASRRLEELGIRVFGTLIRPSDEVR